MSNHTSSKGKKFSRGKHISAKKAKQLKEGKVKTLSVAEIMIRKDHLSKEKAKLKSFSGSFASFGDNDSTIPVVGEYEEVVHPTHYNHLPNGIECWDVTEHFPTNIGSAMKYLWRAGRKTINATKDLEKAKQYIDRQIALINGKTKSMK